MPGLDPTPFGDHNALMEKFRAHGIADHHAHDLIAHAQSLHPGVMAQSGQMGIPQGEMQSKQMMIPPPAAKPMKNRRIMAGPAMGAKAEIGRAHV